MQLPFSEANASPLIKLPQRASQQKTTTTHPSSLPVAHTVGSNLNQIAHPDQPPFIPALDNAALDQASSNDQAVLDDQALLNKAEPLEVVKQTIDNLEAQGLLMVFDRHDQVAKRLTGDLIAAGVLPEERLSGE
ncbi:MAG: hypothetical protein ACAF41_20225 [Leptolyngbya sp. BL-A-14]